jgi:hypothetical protein
MRIYRCLSLVVVFLLLACGDDDGTKTPDGATKTDGGTSSTSDQSASDQATGDASGQTDSVGTGDGPVAVSFDEIDVDKNPDKPAFVMAEDLDGDNKKELIVSVFAGSSPVGNGLLAIYKMNGNLSTWTRQVVVEKSAGIKFPNAVSVADIDGDGDKDLFVPYGFLACTPFNCGGLGWLENTGGASQWVWHDVVKKGNALFYHHVELADMDGDKVKDIVTVGEAKGMFDGGKSETQIFCGDPSLPDRFKSTPVKVGPGLGSLPRVVDIDKDGDLDIVSAQYFGTKTDSVAWYERAGADWNKHVVVTGLGPSIQLSLVPNLLGDGKAIPVLSNHTNTNDDAAAPESAVFLLQPPADLAKPWTPKKISTGIQSRKSPMMGPQAAPGVFGWGDLDGDGDIDLLVSGDGDPNIYWLQQQAGGSFTTNILVKNMPQSGVTAADLDGDGKVEAVVSSYEANRLVLFRRK